MKKAVTPILVLLVLVACGTGTLQQQTNASVATKPSTLESITSEQIPAGWTQYRNDSLDFSAYIPNNWVPKVSPQKADDPSLSVSFAAAPKDVGPDSTVISVLAVPISKGSTAPTVSELKVDVEDWLKKRGVREIQPAAETQINNNSALWVIYEADAVDKSFTARGYAAFFATSSWLYWLEIAGVAKYDDRIRSIYDTFVKGFRSPAQ